MSPEEARTVLLRAFAASSDLPEWALTLVAQAEAPRRPWWRRMLGFKR